MLACLVAQLWLILSKPLDCSPPGSSVHGDSPGKNTGVVCYFLCQVIILTQGMNPHLLHLLHCKWILYPLSHRILVSSVFKWLNRDLHVRTCRLGGKPLKLEKPELEFHFQHLLEHIEQINYWLLSFFLYGLTACYQYLFSMHSRKCEWSLVGSINDVNANIEDTKVIWFQSMQDIYLNLYLTRKD